MQCNAENSSLLSILIVENRSDMAPHCDTMDGPVVKAARRALEARNVNYILPWVHKESEEELIRAFDDVLRVRGRHTEDKEATELVDLWFFETSVRLHRQGEGAPYTGIKPFGTLESPAVPLADEAIEMENPNKVIGFLADALKDELHVRFERAISKKGFDEDDIEAAREYIQAMLGFVLFAGHLDEYIKGDGGGSGLHSKEAESHAQHKSTAKEASATAASIVGA